MAKRPKKKKKRIVRNFSPVLHGALLWSLENPQVKYITKLERIYWSILVNGPCEPEKNVCFDVGWSLKDQETLHYFQDIKNINSRIWGRLKIINKKTFVSLFIRFHI